MNVRELFNRNQNQNKKPEMSKIVDEIPAPLTTDEEEKEEDKFSVYSYSADVVKADPNDELINPLKNYVKTYLAKDVMLLILIPFILRRFPTIYSLNGSSQEVIGLFEASLPSPMKEQVELVHEHKNQQLSSVPVESRVALKNARLAYPKIRALIEKMILEVAKHGYGSDIPCFLDTPKRSVKLNDDGSVASKKSTASKQSTEKSVKVVVVKPTDEVSPLPTEEGLVDTDDEKTADDDLVEDVVKNDEAVKKKLTFLGRRSSTNGVQQDLYETPPEVTMALLNTVFADVVDPSQFVVYDPCAGHDAILKVFEGKGYQVVGDDLYTKEVKKDFLLNHDLPTFSAIVTNPPYSNSTKMLEKMYLLGKPFAILIPMCNLCRGGKMNLLFEYGITIYLLNKRPRFLHNGKEVQVDEVA